MNQRVATLSLGEKTYRYYPVSQIAGHEKLPYSLTVLLENILRSAKSDEHAQTLADRLVQAALAGSQGGEIEFSPARVLFQDFTGVPVFVDFAVMREACKNLGGDPTTINPQVPCDLVIDHSVIADVAGCDGALAANQEHEFERNQERYEFLKWAQESFENVRIVPPGSGICHQLNIEQFASVVMSTPSPEGDVAYFDTLVGTDSHTPTANGIGVLGWGVGGIEAEAAALGQPITILVPQVIGIKLVGSLAEGATAMDVALTFAQILRAEGVVGRFVECFGPGLASLSATQRACISNMTPEYGSTCTLFPVDERTLDYLQLTGRSEGQIRLVEAYAKAQGLWHGSEEPQRTYSQVITIDLSEIRPSVAGPSRPHDRLDLASIKQEFTRICADRKLDASQSIEVHFNGETHTLTHGALAIAAVTSCTTATDASMMIAAGVLARNAHQAGLQPKPWVKTIFAPGSRAVEDILERANLADGLRGLGFYTCGFGCMSCIGNSGPIAAELHEQADRIELASILSGNRNFEGRISPDVAQNYLCAPAAVIAFSLVGTMDFDFETQALGTDATGREVYLRDIWPTAQEVENLLAAHCTRDVYEQANAALFAGDARWQALGKEPSDVFAWDDASTYVRRAPYFDGMSLTPTAPDPLTDAAALLVLGDFITTDHISPAGAIAADSPAARYLREHGVADADFNTYGARRGNHEVMMRGTFANVKLENKLAQGKKGGWTQDQIDGAIKPVFDAAMNYQDHHRSCVVLAGKMYGSGSSRDWAAKGPMLQGVRAVFAESYERIHRSNLIGMGILPLQFKEGDSVVSLGLDGSESISIDPIDCSKGLPVPATVAVCAKKANGSEVRFDAVVRIDTPTEGLYYHNGGILPYVLRSLVGSAEQ